MSIVTLTEAKTFLQISDNDSDVIISALISPAEQSFLKVRGIHFFQFKGTVASGSADITEIAHWDDDTTYTGFEHIYVGLIVEMIVLGVSVIRGSVIDIDRDNATVTLDTPAKDTVSSNICVIYPLDSQYVASQIIGYRKETTNVNVGLKSESVGDWSGTRMDIKSGLPIDISAQIQEFQKAQ